MKWLIFFCLLWPFASLFAQDELIVAALPFYAQSTGWGLGVKAISPQYPVAPSFDSSFYATTKERYGIAFSFGHRAIPGLPWLFWNIRTNWSKQHRDYYGEGNTLPLSTQSHYEYRVWGHSEKLGFNIGNQVKLYGIHLYSSESLGSFVDPDNQFPNFWEQDVPHKKYHFLARGAGLELGKYDSEVRPTKGEKVIYEYYDTYSGEINFQRHFLSMSKLLPILPRWSHGIHLYFESLHGEVPFVKNRPVWVRGVESQRHNGLTSLAIHQESRIYLSSNFILVPFFDMGRVYLDEDHRYLNRIHFGEGLGFRYVYRNALVFRLDAGFSRSGESDILFNYQHTF